MNPKSLELSISDPAVQLPRNSELRGRQYKILNTLGIECQLESTLFYEISQFYISIPMYL